MRFVMLLMPMSASGVCPRRDRRIGFLCVGGAIALSAGFVLLSRLGLTRSTLSVPDIAMLRFSVSGLCMFPVLLAYGFSRLSWATVVLLVTTGGCGFALLAFTGFSLAPGNHAGVLLHGTIAPFSALLGSIFSRHRLSRRFWIGLALIQLGIVTVLADSTRSATPAQLLGDLALLMASLTWAGYGLMCQRLCASPVQIMAIVAVGSLLAFTPVYCLIPSSGLHEALWSEIIWQAVYQGVLIGIVSGLLYTLAVRRLGAHVTALCTATMPCITVLSSAWLLGETPSLLVWLGVLGVSGGMVIALRSQRSQVPPQLTARPDRS